MGTETVAIRTALVKVIEDIAAWRTFIGTEHPKGQFDPRNLESADEQHALAAFVAGLPDTDPVLIGIAEALGDGGLELLDDGGLAEVGAAMNYSSCHGLIARYGFGRRETDPLRFLEAYAFAVAEAAKAAR